MTANTSPRIGSWCYYVSVAVGAPNVLGSNIEILRDAPVVLMGTLAITGCSEPHPYVLLGTWKEADYDRGIVFEENGDFRFVDLDQQLESVTQGMVTWKVAGKELNIELTSGHIHWLGHTATTPPSLRLEYAIFGEVLVLIDGSGEAVAYNKIDVD
jgi:hypothetical protein